MRIFLRITQFLLILVIIGSVLVAGTMYANTVVHRFTALCYRCNIIFISVDGLGANHTSIGNPDLTTTPFLKSLADQRGIVFTHAYSQASWPLPAYTAMLTGRYPWDVGVWEVLDELPPKTRTIFQEFTDHGYHTVGFSTGPYVQNITGLTRGMTEFTGSYQYSDSNDLPKLFVQGSSWMQARPATGSPFFLLLRSFETHNPFGNPGTPGAVTIQDIVSANAKPGGPSATTTLTFQEAYEKEVVVTDQALQAFFTAFDASPYAKNTVVVITAPHGEEFGEHGSSGLSGITVHNELIRVPLIIIIPKHAQKIISATVETRSIPSTLLDIIGEPNQTDFPGQSLLPLIQGTDTRNRFVLSRTASSRQQFLATISDPAHILNTIGSTTLPILRGSKFTAPYSSSVISGKWHALSDIDGTLHLYDMAKDPTEQTDLYPGIKDSHYTPVEQELLARVFSILRTGTE